MMAFLLSRVDSKLSFEESKDFHNLLLILDMYVSKIFSFKMSEL